MSDPTLPSRCGAECPTDLDAPSIAGRVSARVLEPERGTAAGPRRGFVFAGAVATLGGALLLGSCSGLQFEEPAEAEVEPVVTFGIGVHGPIEVSGIRPYYDEDYRAHVRAFVANHSEREQSVALRVFLRVQQATQQAPPLATFQVIISDPLPPRGGQEVDVEMQAMGTLQSLPRWDEMRVDLEVLGGQ